MIWLIFGRWLLDLGWLVFLLLLFRHFWQDRQALVRAQSWLVTKGRITSCQWKEVGHSVWPKIKYSYQAYDTDMTGEYLFLDTAHNNPNSKYARRIAYKAAVAFKDDVDIDVYYNPDDPEQSALDVTVPIKLNLILILIGAFIGLHVALIVWRCLGLW